MPDQQHPRSTISPRLTGGPGGVGVGSILHHAPTERDAVVVGFDPPTCSTFVAWIDRHGESQTSKIDTCDYDDKPCKDWRVVRTIPPYEPTGGAP